MRFYDARRTNIGLVAARIQGAGPGTSSVAVEVRPMVDAVRTGGDRALMKMAARFDGIPDKGLRVSLRALKDAPRRLSSEVAEALQLSKSRIEEYHSRQSLTPFEFRDGCGCYGQKVVPLRRVGVYVPGGRAAYGSSVLMACVPARMAGVSEIVICTPPSGGVVDPLVLTAASMCGVDEVYAVGGAHAVAAMAYGTETIPRVQKVVGPGGLYVSAAKLLVRDACDIDFLAGPSEILIVADADAPPRFLASDMIAQLEHDCSARALLVSDSRSLLESVRSELSIMVSEAERRNILSSSSANGAFFVLVKDLADAIALSNAVAPEHLLLDIANPRRLFSKVTSAGSVFLGRWSSVAFGDYCTGTNHILPTSGTALTRSALSVYDFQKIIPYQTVTREGARRLSRAAVPLATAEGLPSHARAARLRAGKVDA